MRQTKEEKTEILVEFGQNVERAILKKFKNKEEFLRKTGFYRKTLHDILTGAKDAKVTTVYRLAELLGVGPRELFPKA
jgi:hypothetical protein